MRYRPRIALALVALAACSAPSSGAEVPPDDLLDAAFPPEDGAPSPQDDADNGIVPCAWDLTPLDQCTWR